MLKILVCLFTVVIGSPIHAQDAASGLREEAWERLKEGESAMAAELFQRLVEEYPNYYPGYPDYWNSLRKVADLEVMRAHVRLTLPRFEQVPREERTEDLYMAILTGAGLIQDTDKVESVTAEWIERFPKGLAAKYARIDAALAAEDPRVSRSLFLAFIEDFSDDKNKIETAARACFGVIKKHADQFTLEEMVETAEIYDRAATGHSNVAARLLALVTITHTFLDRDPEWTLRFADRGLGFVAEAAPLTDKFDETMGRYFVVAKVMAYAKLKRWMEARSLAAQVLEERGDRRLEIEGWMPLQEPQFRATYADALVASDEVEEAHRQFRYAVALDPSWQEKYDKFCTDHPLDGQHAEAMDQAVKNFMHARSEESKRQVLVKAQNRPAPAFTVLDLEGNKVSLEDFRGKVVVLDFWATWCGPCLAELNDLKKAWKKYKDAPDIEFLAVSIDTDREKVAPFVEKNDYRFPVMLSDGRIEIDYVDIKGGGGIPQLYIIDRKGNIRFHERGFNPEHFLKNLDWMIEAAREAGGDALSVGE